MLFENYTEDGDKTLSRRQGQKVSETFQVGQGSAVFFFFEIGRGKEADLTDVQ